MESGEGAKSSAVSLKNKYKKNSRTGAFPLREFSLHKTTLRAAAYRCGRLILLDDFDVFGGVSGFFHDDFGDLRHFGT